jgi:3-deoxy-D-manno-octulosonate 8-phosphate phosphatase (KDO 8-P phosphatase)
MGETDKNAKSSRGHEAKTPCPSSPITHHPSPITRQSSPITHQSSPITLPFDVPPRVLEAAAQVKLVLFDVDGVLTDARLILGDDGQEYKAFNSKDGHGIKMMQRNGIEAGIITGRSSRVVEHRVRDLGIRHVHQGCKEKHPVYVQLLADLGLTPGQTAFVGDDVVDLPIMLEAGLAICPADAHPLVRRHSHWITPSAGGQGAAREVCEMMLHAHGRYAQEMAKYLNPGGSGG